ncbi:MAG: M20/M25/M40 family metallo-hydrolase [Gemmatimonadales bacterium]
MSRPQIPSLLGLGVLLALAAPLAAQNAPSPATRLARAADSSVMWAHLRFLADDALEGRAPATRGGEIAARYIAAQFERLGLEPAGDSGTYYHRVPIISLTPDPTLSLESAAGARQLTYPDDYVLWSMRNEPAVQTTGDVVFAGYGIVAPEFGWNDYQGLDVRGKIVLVLVNDPGLRDSTIFKGKALTYYGRWTYKIEEAARQGAAGILMVHTPASATYGWATVTGSWTGPQVRLESPATSLVVAGWLTESAAADLVKLGGGDLTDWTRAAGRKGFRGRAMNGVRVAAGVRSVLRRSRTYNVVGRLPGRGAKSAEAILIGGHYDHLGIRAPVNGDSIYNGAEDNASGTAAVLTAAEAFVRSGVRPGRSILFMAFAAEESGLIGSQAFAARPTLPLRNLAAVLNLDVMNVYGRTRDISALGVDQSSIGPVYRRAAAAENIRVTVNQDALIRGSFFRSDHFPFAKAGVPSLSVEGGSEFLGRPAGWGKQKSDEYEAQRYHQPGDEILPWFTMAGAIQQLRVVLRTALALADAPGQPVWTPGSEFRSVGEARVR